MKKVLLATFVMGALLITSKSDAQLRINVNLNIGRPSWGLTNNPYGDVNRPGDYYYLPEIDCYYNIPSRQFIYPYEDRWVYANELPYMYRGYDLNRGYKVIINDPNPCQHADIYRQRYNRYYNVYRDQVMRGGYDGRYGQNPYYNQYPNYGQNPYGNNPYGNRYDRRYYDYKNDRRFNRDREDQHFDNRRLENDRRGRDRDDDDDDDDDNRGWNGNGRWKSERGF